MEGCFLKLRGLERVSLSGDSVSEPACRFSGDLVAIFSVAVKKFRLATGMMSLTLLFLFSGFLLVEGDILLILLSGSYILK